jgi:DNA-directed RNA polymerase subunit RPC12/RpoP
MATYKCFTCGKKISSKNLEKRFVCSNCGSKIFYKVRETISKLKAN